MKWQDYVSLTSNTFLDNSDRSGFCGKSPLPRIDYTNINGMRDLDAGLDGGGWGMGGTI